MMKKAALDPSLGRAPTVKTKIIAKNESKQPLRMPSLWKCAASQRHVRLLYQEA
jgi:hypothetical protein